MSKDRRQRPQLCASAFPVIGEELRSSFRDTLESPITDLQVEQILLLRRRLRERAPRQRPLPPAA